MRRPRSAGRILLLACLAIGLNVLGFVGLVHAQHTAHYSRLHHTHMPGRGTQRSSGRSRRSPRLSAADHGANDYAEAPLLKKPVERDSLRPAYAPIATAVLLHAQQLVLQPFAAAPVLALGSAARAPGSPRGPPQA